jgi:hypothetical protein
MAQTFQTTTSLQRLVGGVLQAPTNPIPVATNTNSITHVYAFPWSPIEDNIPANGTNMVQFTAQGLPATASNPMWTAQGDLAIQASSNFSVRVVNTNFTTRNGPSGQLASDRGQSKGRLTLTYNYLAGDTGACAGLIVTGTCSIDLIKKFTYTTIPTSSANNFVSPIIGPTCLLPNTEYTYSVDETMVDNPNVPIGIDKYTWILSGFTGANAPAASPLYTSSDRSSFTFKTGTSVPSLGTIRCYFGEANVDPATPSTNAHAFSELRLNPAPGIPVVTLSNTAAGGASVLSILPSNNINLPSSCIKTVTGGAGALTFTVAQQPGATYQWTFGTYGSTSNGWNTAVPQVNLPYTATGISFTVANIFNQPGTVTLRVTSNCGSVTDYVYTINRTLTAASSGLITLSSNCTPQGTGITATLLSTGNGAANLNNVSWSVNTNPTNWSFAGGAGTFTLTPSTATPVATYSLTPNFNGCPGTASYSVSVRPNIVSLITPNPFCIARPSTNVPVTFNPIGATQYSYSINGAPGNGNSISPSTSNVVNLSRLPNAQPATLTATYTVAPGCATSSAPQNILLPALTPTVTVPSCVSFGTPGAFTTLTVTNYPGVGTYSLTFVSGTDLITSTGPFPANPQGQILVPISATASGMGTYNLRHSVTGCGTSSASTNFVLDNLTNRPVLTDFQQGVNKLLIPSIIYPTFSGTGTTNWRYFNCGASPQNNCSGGTQMTTNADNLINPVNNVSGSWKLVPQVGTNNVYGAQDTNSIGCIYRVWTTVSLNGYGNARAANDGNQLTKGLSLPASVGKIYPNPNDGKFSILIEQAENNGHAVIIDFSGREVSHIEIKKGLNEFSEERLPAGNYSVIIWLDQKVYANNIVVKSN